MVVTRWLYGGLPGRRVCCRSACPCTVTGRAAQPCRASRPRRMVRGMRPRVRERRRGRAAPLRRGSIREIKSRAGPRRDKRRSPAPASASGSSTRRRRKSSKSGAFLAARGTPSGRARLSRTCHIRKVVLRGGAGNPVGSSATLAYLFIEEIRKECPPSCQCTSPR